MAVAYSIHFLGITITFEDYSERIDAMTISDLHIIKEAEIERENREVKKQSGKRR